MSKNFDVEVRHSTLSKSVLQEKTVYRSRFQCDNIIFAWLYELYISRKGRTKCTDNDGLSKITALCIFSTQPTWDTRYFTSQLFFDDSRHYLLVIWVLSELQMISSRSLKGERGGMYYSTVLIVHAHTQHAGWDKIRLVFPKANPLSLDYGRVPIPHLKLPHCQSSLTICKI